MEADFIGYSIDEVIEHTMIVEAYNQKLLCILRNNQEDKEQRAWYFSFIKQNEPNFL